MTVFRFVHPAGPGERYAATAWDSQIGKTVPLNIGERRSRCKVIAAEVRDGGRWVELTIEADEPAALAEPGLYEVDPGGMSIRFKAKPAERRS